MGEEFTAMNFRSWGASRSAFVQLWAAGEDGISRREMREPVDEALGNTPAISRKSYVHPALVEAVKQNPRDPVGGLQCPRATKYLSSAERGLIEFLDNEAARTETETKAA